jgi:RHS repeat-associated protein
MIGKLDGAGQKFFYIQDHLSSVRVVLNQSGNVDSWTDYYPFGKESRGSSTANRPKEQFTGKERDSEIGLDYFGARYYNADVGRWISVDPMQDKYPDFTPYNYVLNNPLGYFDPEGKDVVNQLDSNGNVVSTTLVPNGTYNIVNINVDGTREIVGQVDRMQHLLDLQKYGGSYAVHLQLLNDEQHQNAMAYATSDEIYWDAIAFAGLPFLIEGGASLIQLIKAYGKQAVKEAISFIIRNPVKAGVEYASTREKLFHLFRNPAHNLESLVNAAGGEKQALEAVLKELIGKLPNTGRFEETVGVFGQNVTVRGVVQDGIPKIGTMFIK